MDFGEFFLAKTNQAFH